MGETAIVGSINDKENPKVEDFKEAEEGEKSNKMFIVAGSLFVTAIGAAAFLFMK